MEIKYGASQRILISVSQDTKYRDIQSDRGRYPSNFNRTGDCAKAHARCAKAKTKVEEERHRSLPAQLVVCLIIAMSLWSRDSMRDVLKNLIDGLSEAWVKVGKYWRFPCKSAITQARQRLVAPTDETTVSSVGATNGKSAKQ